MFSAVFNFSIAYGKNICACPATVFSVNSQHFRDKFHFRAFNRFTPKSGKYQDSIKKKTISLCKILESTWYHANVVMKRFHLNGHTIGFRPRTQKLELHYMPPLLTLV